VRGSGQTGRRCLQFASPDHATHHAPRRPIHLAKANRLSCLPGKGVAWDVRGPKAGPRRWSSWRVNDSSGAGVAAMPCILRRMRTPFGPAARTVARARARRRRRLQVAALVGGLLLIAGTATTLTTGASFSDSTTAPRSVLPAIAGDTTHHPPLSTGSATRAPSRHKPSSRDVYAGIRPGHWSAAVRGIPMRVYVPDSMAATVSVIDPATFKVVRVFHVGTYDQHISPAWNLRSLYVNNTSGNSLTQLDPRTGRILRSIPVVDPYNLYFTPDGSKAVVVAESLQRIDFRNPRTWRLIKSVHIPASGPDHLDFTASGRSLLISCEFTGRVYRVDTVAMRVTGSVDVGGLPVDVKLSPDGRRFYVANQGLGGVTVIDAKNLRILGFIRTGRGAHGMAISRDTRNLYVSNRLAGTISLIRFATGNVAATWRVGGSPDMLQVSPSGRRLWVSNRYNGTVSVINTTTGRLVSTISVGASPHGLTFFPQPGIHSLGHNGVYR
jgi:YVTN family beta-propeller protein